MSAKRIGIKLARLSAWGGEVDDNVGFGSVNN